MSLLDEQYDDFVFLDRKTVQDGLGGYYTVWSEGASIRAAVVLDNSTTARAAAVQGLTSVYTITTSRAVTLRFPDVIKRVADGKIFRVTSDGTDKKTPGSAGLDMRQVSAEEWSLPT